MKLKITTKYFCINYLISIVIRLVQSISDIMKPSVVIQIAVFLRILFEGAFSCAGSIFETRVLNDF